MAHDGGDPYRIVVEHSPHAVMIVRSEPRSVFFANPAMESFSGYEASELAGMPVRELAELVHREDRDRFLQELERLLAGDAASDRTEYRFVRRDGAVVWARSWATRIELEGQPAALLSLADDTERRSAVDELGRSQAKLRQVQHIAGIGDFTWEIATGVVTWSEGMYRLLGRDSGEAMDLRRIDAEIHHPDDRERVTAWLEAGAKSGEQVLERNEYRLLRKGGEVIHVQTNGRFELQQGKAVRLFGTCLDITDRKRAEDALLESEQRLVAAQHLANLGDWWWNVRTGEVQWSEQVYEIFRLDPDEFVPQIDSILALSPWPEDHQRDQELIQRAIESREVGSYEQRFLRPDGSTGYYASTFMGVYDDHGELVAMKGTVQDITLRKQSEKEKAELLQHLHHAQKMESVGRLAGGVAHDFNNMLCAILGNAELALREPAIPGSVQQSLEEVREAAHRAASLTRQLLAFSRKQIVEPRVIDLGELIRRLHPMLDRLIGEDVRLRTVAQPALGSVRADPGLVEQIVLNLVVNARDAMPDGGELLIETSNAELDEEYCRRHTGVTAGPHVMLAVSDTGAGIPEEIRDKIFEPFFTTKQLGQGTGLGLATVFGIVQQNHGRIEVYSEPGHGTTFKVYFPRVSEHAESLEHREASRAVDGSETVLVVEDETMVRTLAVKLLRRRGYDVLAVRSGEEALDLASQHEGSIDLLLTDVVMPGMNGAELAAILGRQRPQMKVLFASGYTDNVIVHHGVLEPGLAFLSKPYSSDTLAAKVREVLDAPHGPHRGRSSG